MKNINGQTLKEMLISGSNNLYNNYPEIDALNVFPVPDGDTGMNMNLTLTSGCKEISSNTDNNIYEIAKSFSRGTLMGARGNSGVITSQIWRGFAQGLEGKKEINARELSQAFENGVKVAYKAVVKPVEGTILTVVRESSSKLSEVVTSSFSIEKAMDTLIDEAKKSLKHTPDLLPILKEVGVVDSGGAGLVKIFEGMRLAIEGKKVIRNESVGNEENPIVAAGSQMEDEEFGYCTEFIMSLGPDSTKKPFNERRFTSILNSHGNSLVVVHDEDIVKVHVHTMTPGSVLNYAQQFGEFLKLKIENMTEQHHALETGEKVEQHVDLVEEKRELRNHCLIAVGAGKGINELFKNLGVDYVVSGGQTMNPSAEDFLDVIKKANSKNIYIFPNNSNIVMAANQASEMFEDDSVSIFVIPSKTIPQGISSVVNFNAEASGEDNYREMKMALKNVKSGEVTYAIRDSLINGVQVKKDDFISICDKEIVADSSSLVEVTKKLLDYMIDDDSSVATILVGEGVNQEDVDSINEYMENTYEDVDVEIQQGDQPVYSFLIGIE